MRRDVIPNATSLRRERNPESKHDPLRPHDTTTSDLFYDLIERHSSHDSMNTDHFATLYAVWSVPCERIGLFYIIMSAAISNINLI